MSERSWSAAGLVGLVAVVLAGCPSGRAPAAPVAHGARPLVSSAVTIYEYPPTIVTYPPADRGAYVVELERSPAGDAARGRLPATALDDIVGEDGHVVRLTEAERAGLAAAAGVREVRPLQPHERQAVRQAPAGGEVRLDLFADVSEAEADAVATWIEASGGRVSWRGPTALTASLPADGRARASRLSPVRWVE